MRSRGPATSKSAKQAPVPLSNSLASSSTRTRLASVSNRQYGKGEGILAGPSTGISVLIGALGHCSDMEDSCGSSGDSSSPGAGNPGAGRTLPGGPQPWRQPHKGLGLLPRRPKGFVLWNPFLDSNLLYGMPPETRKPSDTCAMVSPWPSRDTPAAITEKPGKQPSPGLSNAFRQQAVTPPDRVCPWATRARHRCRTCRRPYTTGVFPRVRCPFARPLHMS